MSDEIEKLRKERDEAQKALRVVQNAAKTLHRCQDTELQHLRENAAFDHLIRAERESLMDRDAVMTAALEAAEAQRDAAIDALRVAQKALSIASRQLSEDHKHVLGGKAWGASALAAIDAVLKHGDEE